MSALRLGHGSRARAFIILGVLIVGASALLIASGFLFLSAAEHAGARSAAQLVQARATATSGLNVLMARLDGQRERILRGERVELPDQITIYERAGGIGVIRLLPVGPGDERLVPEASRIDVHRATAEALVQSGFVGPEVAQAVIAARDARPGKRCTSLADLCGGAVLTEDVMFGEDDRDMIGQAQIGQESDDLAARVERRVGEVRLRGLQDLLTVHAVEPALERSGRKRIRIDTPWSEEFGARLDERFGEGAGRLVKALLDQGTDFGSLTAVAQTLVKLGSAPESWVDILDAITVSTDGLEYLRLDVNRASFEAIAALPGLSPEQAQQIVDRRAILTPEELQTPLWPMLTGIVTKEQFVPLADVLSVRSWTWRFRIAAGEVSADDPDGPMTAPYECEVVIDLCDPQARIAYLRDTTNLGLALALAESAPVAEEVVEPDERSADEAAPESPAGAGEGQDLDAEGLDFKAPELEGSAPEEDDPGLNSEAPPAAPVVEPSRRVGRWIPH